MLNKGPLDENDEKIKNAFDLLMKPPRNEMRLSVFERKYLPFLSLKPIEKEVVDKMLAEMQRQTGARHTERDLIGNLLNEWGSDTGFYLGAAYLYTDIIDDATRDIIFVVPPLIDGSQDPVLNGAELPALVEQAGNHSRVVPQMGTNFINQRIVPLIKQVKVNYEHLELWNKIFRHYGLPLYKFGDALAEAPEGVVKVDIDGTEVISSLGYDDD